MTVSPDPTPLVETSSVSTLLSGFVTFAVTPVGEETVQPDALRVESPSPGNVSLNEIFDAEIRIGLSPLRRPLSNFSAPVSFSYDRISDPISWDAFVTVPSNFWFGTLSLDPTATPFVFAAITGPTADRARTETSRIVANFLNFSCIC
ncbi:hypothetical protein [Halocalculus aciditolerans]|uniref:hypothetical protein n=1 Tax=Halocalculus aciditolerans TaxID=1383812 RepID=UPI001667EEFD|nr:hypothetical protein [Halocalculus aciditolerans]